MKVHARPTCIAIALGIAAGSACAQGEPDRLLESCYAHIRAGDDKGALQLFETSFARRRATPRQYVDAAYTAHRLGQNDPAYDKQALRLFESSFAQQPGTARQYVDAAYTACRLGENDPAYDRQALQLFEASFARHAGTALEYIDAAYIARRLGDSDPAYDRQAMLFFEASFALQPGTALQYVDAAYTARRLGKNDPAYDKLALRYFDASFALQPGTALQYVDAAYTARRLGENDPAYDKLALRYFDASFALQPGTALQYVDAAYTARRLGNSDPAYDKLALRYFDASFALQRGTALQYVDAAYTARRLGQNDPAYDKLALRYFEASFALQPGTAQQYLDAAYTARRLGERDPAYDKLSLRFFDASFAVQPGAAHQYLDAAYTARRVGRDYPAYEKDALRYFAAGFTRQHESALEYADAAYTARGLGENELADRFFHDSIDANAQAPQYDAEQAYAYRRAVDDAERRVGAIVNVAYQSGGFRPQETIGILQGGTEVYWQPPKIGYDNGRIFQVFARQYSTLYDRSGGITGLPTLQWSVGARYKPLSSQNLVFTAEKLMTGGRYAYDDWLFRVGYSIDGGIDLHPVKPDWTTWQFYTESAYFVRQQRLVQPVELRYGHSWRIDSISSHLVMFPHAAIAGDYDTRALHKLALGIGPGIGMRYWFRESAYRAPASWIDLDVQYRVRLTDADRAKGLVVRATLWF
ncbi:3-isopropylmalate dehydratase [Burkholderia vietnamiensis]|uniref:NfrA family protein n=1 Tax=Burkholderia vietnamiensis TaxID=60552 RepID=UPI0007591946|nr:bacteriophage N4 adsorption protein A [Burkholderia vietnamiensis]KVR79690.1 3-isopropylmalate dehydratase [Burkholderia vietnamiensis]